MGAASWPFRMRYIMETGRRLSPMSAQFTRMASKPPAGWQRQIMSLPLSRMPLQAALLQSLLSASGPENALFSDNDPAEANATWKGQRIGFPLPNALWRTNHALSAVLMPTQVPLWNDTLQRYDMMRQFIIDAAPPPAINESYATAIVATLGQKGADYYTCGPDYSGAEHVISVVYNPIAQRLLAAWEDGSGASWTPGFLHFLLCLVDLGIWW